MKDELESKRLCKTVVFANIAPMLADNAKTLSYVAPITSPASWSNEKYAEGVKKKSNGKIAATPCVSGS